MKPDYKKNMAAILFLRGRLRFHREDGTPGETATAPSALIAFSGHDAEVLEAVNIPGYIVTQRARTP